MYKKIAINKLLPILLTICILFVTLGSTISANTTDSKDNEYNFELIQKDENYVKVKAIRSNGDELYATLDKKNDEITMEAIEHKQDGIFTQFLNKATVSESVYKSTLYTVDAETINESVVDAVITDNSTGQEYKISEGTDKVTAQLPALIPVITWGGAALLAWLLEQAVAMTIAGVIAYAIDDLISDIKKQNKAVYWPAWIRNNNVYIARDAFETEYAAFQWLGSKNDMEVNLFAKTENKAKQAAAKITSFYKYEQAHGGDGYLPHYHPVDRFDKKTPFANHVWFWPGT